MEVIWVNNEAFQHVYLAEYIFYGNVWEVRSSRCKGAFHSHLIAVSLQY